MRGQFEAIGTFMVVLLVVAIAALAFGISHDEPAAWMVLGALVAVVLGALGAGVVLLVMYFAHRMERSRAEVEQGQFAQNAKENMDLMRTMANAQNAQARAQVTTQRLLTNENRDLRRALPAPGDTIDTDARITFDAALFDELELEE